MLSSETSNIKFQQWDVTKRIILKIPCIKKNIIYNQKQKIVSK